MSLWEGHQNHDNHRTVGERAWCSCGQWCYEDSPCYCCAETFYEYAVRGLKENSDLKARISALELELASVRECPQWGDCVAGLSESYRDEAAALRKILAEVPCRCPRPGPEVYHLPECDAVMPYRPCLNGAPGDMRCGNCDSCRAMARKFQN